MNSPSPDPPPLPPSRFQFRLRDLFVLMATVSLVLALTTQWRHVGLVAGCFAAGILVGVWRSSPRLLIGSLAGLCVFIATYAAAWVQIGTNEQMNGPWNDDGYQLRRVDELLDEYRQAQGVYPDSLAELEDPQQYLQRNAAGQVINRWSHPLVYRQTEQGYDVISLGRNGRPGGWGADEDSSSPRSLTRLVSPRLPLRTFFFDTNGSWGVFLAALIGSLVTANLGWQMPRLSLSPVRVACSVIVIIAGAAWVAFFLAEVYVAAGNSGH
jgi:hypothetical protein